MLNTILISMTIVALIIGTFFMFVAAVGLVRMPDIYHRMHAATKGVTLGMMGLLIGAAIFFAMQPGANIINILTKVFLVIIFQFIANPVGAHLLSKAAKIDHAPRWHNYLSDEQDQEAEPTQNLNVTK